MKNKTSDHFVAGTYYDKYGTKNPISRLLMKGFLSAFDSLLEKVGPAEKVLEIGAGEGNLAARITKKFPESALIVTDYSSDILETAKKTLKNNKNITIEKQNAEKLTYPDSHFDCIVCCEVLEHLQDPECGLREIFRVLKGEGFALISVPNEPIWRILNMARGAYLSDWGNTPGHLNHWSTSHLRNFLCDNGFVIQEFLAPFPWSMALVKKKV